MFSIIKLGPTAAGEAMQGAPEDRLRQGAAADEAMQGDLEDRLRQGAAADRAMQGAIAEGKVPPTAVKRKKSRKKSDVTDGVRGQSPVLNCVEAAADEAMQGDLEDRLRQGAIAEGKVPSTPVKRTKNNRRGVKDRIRDKFPASNCVKVADAMCSLTVEGDMTASLRNSFATNSRALAAQNASVTSRALAAQNASVTSSDMAAQNASVTSSDMAAQNASVTLFVRRPHRGLLSIPDGNTLLSHWMAASGVAIGVAEIVTACNLLGSLVGRMSKRKSNCFPGSDALQRLYARFPRDALEAAVVESATIGAVLEWFSSLSQTFTAMNAVIFAQVSSADPTTLEHLPTALKGMDIDPAQAIDSSMELFFQLTIRAAQVSFLTVPFTLHAHCIQGKTLQRQTMEALYSGIEGSYAQLCKYGLEQDTTWPFLLALVQLLDGRPVPQIKTAAGEARIGQGAGCELPDDGGPDCAAQALPDVQRRAISSVLIGCQHLDWPGCPDSFWEDFVEDVGGVYTSAHCPPILSRGDRIWLDKGAEVMVVHQNLYSLTISIAPTCGGKVLVADLTDFPDDPLYFAEAIHKMVKDVRAFADPEQEISQLRRVRALKAEARLRLDCSVGELARLQAAKEAASSGVRGMPTRKRASSAASMPALDSAIHTTEELVAAQQRSYQAASQRLAKKERQLILLRIQVIGLPLLGIDVVDDQDAEEAPRAEQNLGEEGSRRAEQNLGTEGSRRAEQNLGEEGSRRAEQDLGTEGSRRAEQNLGAEGAVEHNFTFTVKDRAGTQLPLKVAPEDAALLKQQIDRCRTWLKRLKGGMQRANQEGWLYLESVFLGCRSGVFAGGLGYVRENPRGSTELQLESQRFIRPKAFLFQHLASGQLACHNFVLSHALSPVEQISAVRAISSHFLVSALGPGVIVPRSVEAQALAAGNEPLIVSSQGIRLVAQNAVHAVDGLNGAADGEQASHFVFRCLHADCDQDADPQNFTAHMRAEVAGRFFSSFSLMEPCLANLCIAACYEENLRVSSALCAEIAGRLRKGSAAFRAFKGGERVITEAVFNAPKCLFVADGVTSIALNMPVILKVEEWLNKGEDVMTQYCEVAAFHASLRSVKFSGELEALQATDSAAEHSIDAGSAEPEALQATDSAAEHSIDAGSAEPDGQLQRVSVDGADTPGVNLGEEEVGCFRS